MIRFFPLNRNIAINVEWFYMGTEQERTEMLNIKQLYLYDVQ